MTPSRFLKEYHDLSVVFCDAARSTDSELVFSEARIKVRTYISNAGNPCAEQRKGKPDRTEEEIKACLVDPSNKKKLKGFDRAKERNAEKDKTQSGADHEVKLAVNRAFNGKGSPGDIATALAQAVELNRCGSTKAEIQVYCDKWLGLDCNGLTDRFFEKPTSWEPHRYLSGATQRKELQEIIVGDVLVWCDSAGRPHTKPPNRHIALVDHISLSCSSLSGQRGLVRPKSKGRGKTIMTVGSAYSTEFLGINCGARITVVESTGTLGPVESSYPVIDQWSTAGKSSETVFRVRRLHKYGSAFVRIAKPTL